MLVGSNCVSSSFPGALTTIISFDRHHHPCKRRGSRHRARWLVTRARRASFAQQAPLHEGWGQLARGRGHS